MDTKLLTGYARCSTDEQDLTAQCQSLLAMGVSAERIYTDKGLTGTNRNRPGLDQALAAVRAGDTLAVGEQQRLPVRLRQHQPHGLLGSIKHGRRSRRTEIH